MSETTLLILGAISIAAPLLLTAGLVWLVVRTGHGPGWVLLALLPLVAKALLVTGGPLALGQGLLTQDHYVLLGTAPDVILALLLLALAAKSWPRNRRK